MPMKRAGAGRLAISPVKDSRIAHISGKILMASNKAIVGRMKSQAIDRSDRPRTRLAAGAVVRIAILSTSVGVAFVPFMSSARALSVPSAAGAVAEGAIGLSPD